MIKCKVNASQINALIFYKSDHSMQQSKLLQQILELCNHGLVTHLVHFKQPHNDKHGDPCVIQKFDNQSKIIHIAMGHSQIKTSRHYCYRCKTWQNMLVRDLLDHGR